MTKRKKLERRCSQPGGASEARSGQALQHPAQNIHTVEVSATAPSTWREETHFHGIIAPRHASLNLTMTWRFGNAVKTMGES